MSRHPDFGFKSPKMEATAMTIAIERGVKYPFKQINKQIFSNSFIPNGCASINQQENYKKT